MEIFERSVKKVKYSKIKNKKIIRSADRTMKKINKKRKDIIIHERTKGDNKTLSSNYRRFNNFIYKNSLISRVN